MARRFAALVVLFGSWFGVAACAAPAPAPAGSLGAMGDSITRGFDACTLLSDCLTKSWATGSDPSVVSHYRRLLALNPAIAGHDYNAAQVGATSFELPAQAQSLTAHKPAYVTVLIGANDACTDTEAQMTSPSVLRANVDAALATIYAARPDTRVLVASIPDVYRLWQVGHTSSGAQAAWSFGFCHTMLDRPTSLAAADESRRQRVRARIQAFNTQLAAACAAHATCSYDGGAVFRYPFALSQLSTFDYFHPNGAGQKALADITWGASGW